MQARLMAACTTVAAAFLLTACGQNGASVESSPTQHDIVGTWGSDEKGHPHLTFDADGHVKGTDGCNGIRTTYEKTGDGAQFGFYASTRRGCPGVSSWLQGVTRVTYEGDTMTAYSGKKKLGTLDYEGKEPADSESATS